MKTLFYGMFAALITPLAVAPVSAAAAGYGHPAGHVYFHGELHLIRALEHFDLACHRPHARYAAAELAAAELRAAGQEICQQTARHLVWLALRKIEQFCHDRRPSHLEVAARLTQRALEIERRHHHVRHPHSPPRAPVAVPYGGQPAYGRGYGQLSKQSGPVRNWSFYARDRYGSRRTGPYDRRDR